MARPSPLRPRCEVTFPMANESPPPMTRRRGTVLRTAIAVLVLAAIGGAVAIVVSGGGSPPPGPLTGSGCARAKERSWPHDNHHTPGHDHDHYSAVHDHHCDSRSKEDRRLRLWATPTTTAPKTTTPTPPPPRRPPPLLRPQVATARTPRSHRATRKRQTTPTPVTALSIGGSTTTHGVVDTARRRSMSATSRRGTWYLTKPTMGVRSRPIPTLSTTFGGRSDQGIRDEQPERPSVHSARSHRPSTKASRPDQARHGMPVTTFGLDH